MIQIRFEEREKIGLQYILESLHGCSPFGQERIRRLRYYTPDERQELEQELRNVERAAAHAEELKDLYDQICVVLCQMKDIRGSLRRCRELEVPDHVELFELKGYLQRLETLRPLFEKLRDTAGLTGLAFHDPAAALAILDPENTRSRGFYIPDAATPRLREIRSAKKQVEEQLYRAQTDAEKDDLRQKRVRICAEEDSEEMKVRRSMGAALAPMADDLLAKNPQSALAQNVRLQAYANKKDYAKVIELGQAAADAQTDPADKSLMYYLLGAAYNAKEMKPQAIAAFKQVTDGPAAENAKAALAELSK